MSTLKRISAFVTTIILLFAIAGCSDTGIGAGVGAGGGALVGSAVGHPIIGALIGGVGGGVAGHEIGKSQNRDDSAPQKQSISGED